MVRLDSTAWLGWNLRLALSRKSAQPVPETGERTVGGDTGHGAKARPAACAAAPREGATSKAGVLSPRRSTAPQSPDPTMMMPLNDFIARTQDATYEPAREK
jgi:hypothetical protein